MYSIKQASIRSGVSVPLIRAWERRYGVVRPARAASGYRLYDDEAIATLVRVRELTEDGWTASEASRAVLAGEVSVTTPLVARAPSDSGATPARYGELIERFIRAAADLDIPATGHVLDEIFAIGSFESIVDDLIMPALVELGDAWSTGRIDVAAEHAASSAVYRRLATLYDAAAVARETHIVVGLPPGARHELGAFAFAVAARRRGAGVLYLGADVPVASWVRAVEERDARMAVLAVVQHADRPATLDVVRALHASGSAPIIALGGRYANVDAGDDTAVVRLPLRIAAAAETAVRLARAPRQRTAREGASR